MASTIWHLAAAVRTSQMAGAARRALRYRRRPVRSPLELERHPLGPRVRVLGRRVHEWHLGVAVAATVLGAWWGGIVDMRVTAFAAGAGIWLMAKDWRDLFAPTRDTFAWSPGLHRRSHALRSRPRGDWIPGAAAAAAAIVGVGNLVSAATPDVAWRARLLLRLEPVSLAPVVHAVVVPASASLALVSLYLAKRRRRAWRVAFALALALVPLNVVKGLDLEDAVGALATAALLYWGRDAFVVRHDPATARAALWRVPAIAAAVGALATAIAYAAAPPGAALGGVMREAGDLLLWSTGSYRFADELSMLPLAIGLVELGALALCAYVIFRPLAVPRSLPDAGARRLAADLVHRHGRDTLAFFKLRDDVHYLFSHDRRAFLAYRVERGVLLLSGDPVGPEDALPALAREVTAFAELRGLKLGAVGVGAPMARLFEQVGLRALYLGDEAIVETARFSLEGRPIRKVRQSVSRLERLGYRTELHRVGELEPGALRHLDAVSRAWRDQPERGFSMALDRLGGEGVLVLARDSEGVVRGLLHFVPTYGRAAVSLSAMRRERDTPNGLVEFLVARAIELLRAEGVDEVSLNFAAFARLLREPRNRRERLLRRLLGVGDRFFQIESLLRFNAKFFPRWEPRFVLYEGALGLPRTGLASLIVEGQVVWPSLHVRLHRRVSVS